MGLTKRRLVGSSVLFLFGKSFCLCVLLIILTPYQSTDWRTALNDFLAFDSYTLAQPFFAQRENRYSPLNFHFRTHVHCHTHSSPLPPCNLCQDKHALVTSCLNQAAEASTSEWTDWQPKLRQQPAGLVSPSPGDENILSWAHPLPHRTIGVIVPCVQKPGSILYHLCALPPSCLTWKYCWFFDSPSMLIRQFEHRG